jgi:hypothetical protein
MEKTVHVVLSVALAVVTFLTGVGVVRAAELIESLLSSPTHVQMPENIGVSSSENFHTLMPSGVGETTVGQGRVLSCYDPTILPVWNELKKDKNFSEWVDGSEGVMNCSDMVAIKKTDLNRDGLEDTLVRGKGPHLCSATGNCGFWILSKHNDRWRTILSGSDYSEYETLEDQVQRTSTRRYSDILLKSHYTAAETGFRTYKFDGARYVESRCMYEVPKYGRDGEGSMKLITCAEFERREEEQLAYLRRQ